MSQDKPVDPFVRVEIYTADGCCLCRQAKTVLQSLEPGVPYQIVEIDIAKADDINPRYRAEIPVIHIAGRKAFKFHVDPKKASRLIQRAWSRLNGAAGPS